jgi:hypothetical protein
LSNAKTDVKAVYAGSFAYLRLCGLVLGAWQMARGLLAAQRLRDDDPNFYDAKIATARFFAEHLLPQAQALAISIVESGHSTNALAVEQF